MATPGGLAAGLAFLPTWQREDREGFVLDALFSSWVRASGWKLAGLAWPLKPAPEVVFVVHEDFIDGKAKTPNEWRDVAESLTSGGQTTAVWQLPQSAGRLYTLVQPPGRAPGLLWVEKTDAVWSAEERAYFRLSAKLIERCPALGSRIGLSVDSERLNQRLTDMSVIAGRMAHDFDNVLTGIMGFTDLTLPLVAHMEQPARFVQEIAKVSQRGVTFTSQLHQFSRAGQARPQPGNVAAALAKEDLRLRGAMPAGMKVRVDVPANLPMVAMEASALQQVLGHVLENAVEAGTGTTTVTVSARNLELNPSEAQGYLGRVLAGPHIEVVITDTGGGIKDDVRAKLFAEPFFTTKVRHRGLGLAIVYRILHAHRGGVRIDAAPPSEPGTVVRVVIPHAAARPAIVTAASPVHTLGG